MIKIRLTLLTIYNYNKNSKKIQYVKKIKMKFTLVTHK